MHGENATSDMKFTTETPAEDSYQELTHNAVICSTWLS